MHVFPRHMLNEVFALGPLSRQAELTTIRIKIKSYRLQLSALQKLAEKSD